MEDIRMTRHENFSNRHQPPPRSAASDEASALAWITLALGLGSWLALPLLGAVAAVVCGFIERRKIAEGSSSPKGKTLVTVGMVAGGIQVALAFLAMIACILFLALMFVGAVAA